jgi:hypothetical protein
MASRAVGAQPLEPAAHGGLDAGQAVLLGAEGAGGVAVGVPVEGPRRRHPRPAVHVGLEQRQHAVDAVQAAGRVGNRAAIVGQTEPIAHARIGQALHPAVAGARHGVFKVLLVYGEWPPKSAVLVVGPCPVDRGRYVVAGQARVVAGLDAASGQVAHVVVDAGPVGAGDQFVGGGEFAGAGGIDRGIEFGGDLAQLAGVGAVSVGPQGGAFAPGGVRVLVEAGGPPAVLVGVRSQERRLILAPLGFVSRAGVAGIAEVGPARRGVVDRHARGGRGLRGGEHVGGQRRRHGRGRRPRVESVGDAINGRRS